MSTVSASEIHVVLKKHEWYTLNIIEKCDSKWLNAKLRVM